MHRRPCFLCFIDSGWDANPRAFWVISDQIFLAERLEFVSACKSLGVGAVEERKTSRRCPFGVQKCPFPGSKLFPALSREKSSLAGLSVPPNRVEPWTSCVPRRRVPASRNKKTPH